MTEHDYMYARTPTGAKVHVVDMEQESMLAVGKPDTSDYASMCGHAPESWRTQLDAPDSPGDVCRPCARKALSIQRSSGDVLAALPGTDQAYLDAAAGVQIDPMGDDDD